MGDLGEIPAIQKRKNAYVPEDFSKAHIFPENIKKS